MHDLTYCIIAECNREDEALIPFSYGLAYAVELINPPVLF